MDGNKREGGSSEDATSVLAPSSSSAWFDSKSCLLRFDDLSSSEDGRIGCLQLGQPFSSSCLTFSVRSCRYATVRTRISSLNSFSPDFDFPLPFFGSSSSSSLRSPRTSLTRLYSGGTSSLKVARASLIFVRLAFSMREWLVFR